MFYRTQESGEISDTEKDQLQCNTNQLTSDKSVQKTELRQLPE